MKNTRSSFIYFIKWPHVASKQNPWILRPIYTVQLCRMRYVYDKPTTRIVSCKWNLQLVYDCRVRHEECRGLLKHVLKPYDNRSHRQFDIVEIVYDFSLTRAARAIKIACDNRRQESYRVNRPLQRNSELWTPNHDPWGGMVGVDRTHSLSHTGTLVEPSARVRLQVLTQKQHIWCPSKEQAVVWCRIESHLYVDLC